MDSNHRLMEYIRAVTTPILHDSRFILPTCKGRLIPLAIYLSGKLISSSIFRCDFNHFTFLDGCRCLRRTGLAIHILILNCDISVGYKYLHTAFVLIILSG